MWLLAGTALLGQSAFEVVSVKSWTSPEVGGVRKVIDLPGECRSVSQKNADRFHARMVIGFRRESVIDFGENPQLCS
jgi:hypothetical protein